MIIVGAKGMAMELLEILSIEQGLPDEAILFYDNINKPLQPIDARFKVLSNDDEVLRQFSSGDTKFCLGLGNPKHRKAMAEKFISLGGTLTSVISNKAHIGSFGTVIGAGCTIMQGVVITNNVSLGEGVLVNVNSTISHDSVISSFTEIGCGVTIPGRCTIGTQSFLGSNTVLNPDVSIGKNTIIGSGSVVIKNVTSNIVVAGNPSKIITSNE